MADEDPYNAPPVDESKWFSGGHLGGATQQINWQVVNCTTPANYFHVLRRQVRLKLPPPSSSYDARLLPWCHVICCSTSIRC